MFLMNQSIQKNLKFPKSLTNLPPHLSQRYDLLRLTLMYQSYLK
jgi:hypothetical protein